MGALSPTHWLIIIGVVVVLFGAKKLPEAARGLGRSSRILKAELHGLHDNPAPAATAGPQVQGAPGIPAADTQHDPAVASAARDGARDDATSGNTAEPAASPPRQR